MRSKATTYVIRQVQQNDGICNQPHPRLLLPKNFFTLQPNSWKVLIQLPGVSPVCLTLFCSVGFFRSAGQPLLEEQLFAALSYLQKQLSLHYDQINKNKENIRLEMTCTRSIQNLNSYSLSPQSWGLFFPWIQLSLNLNHIVQLNN